ncbi:MAG TPA: SDR family NAD(P)-dependent oxidoreductase [Chitinophagaceae bacterium]|nr:SDR family NAD(P)-dependent oxidoreductase [Chitinophagaceae bacterium]
MKHVLVTGASGNLGKAVINRFLAAGDRVSGIVIPGDKIPLEAASPQFSKFEADLNNESQSGEIVGEIISRHGDINVAVLTAGGFAMGGIKDTGSADILTQFRLNFETAYHIARPVFLNMMAQGRGRIFLVGSRPGLDMRNSKGMTAYGLSKSLLFRLAELLNEEAKGTDVVTIVIVPSTIDTPQNRASMPDADFSTWMDPVKMAEIIHFHTTTAADGLREPVLKMFNKA